MANKIGTLEVYGEEKKEEPKKKSLLGKMWDNTVGKKLQEKAEEDELRKEARTEARDEIKKVLKEKYIKEEIEKATKPKKNALQSLADEFKAVPGTLKTDEKLERMLGSSSRTNTSTDGRIGRMPDFDVAKILSTEKSKVPGPQTEKLSLKNKRFDEGIRRALGK